MKEYFNKTANVKEGTDEQKLKKMETDWDNGFENNLNQNHSRFGKVNINVVAL